MNMKPQLLLNLIVCVALITGLGAIVPRTDAAAGIINVIVLIDGEYIEMDSPARLIDSVTYVPLFEFSQLLGAESTEQYRETAVVSAPGLSIYVTAGYPYIVANGRYLFAPTLCRMIDGMMFVPVRPLAKAFGATVTWRDNPRTVSIEQSGEPIKPGYLFYDATDLFWMSRIISAEARGECLIGRIAVGNVVMNRVNYPAYPNSVHGVIFDRRHGVQFTPAHSGAINRTPYIGCVIAAKLALDGARVVGDSLFFSMRTIRCWASRNREYYTTIGNHRFFA